MSNNINNLEKNLKDAFPKEDIKINPEVTLSPIDNIFDFLEENKIVMEITKDDEELEKDKELTTMLHTVADNDQIKIK